MPDVCELLCVGLACPIDAHMVVGRVRRSHRGWHAASDSVRLSGLGTCKNVGSSNHSMHTRPDGPHIPTLLMAGRWDRLGYMVRNGQEIRGPRRPNPPIGAGSAAWSDGPLGTLSRPGLGFNGRDPAQHLGRNRLGVFTGLGPMVIRNPTWQSQSDTPPATPHSTQTQSEQDRLGWLGQCSDGGLHRFPLSHQLRTGY